MITSGSLIHTPTAMVQHEAFEGSHKRFPSHDLFFKIFITQEHRTAILGKVVKNKDKCGLGFRPKTRQ